ncbi:MAG: hypothetical protein K6G56_04480 [Clostridiales bacterium]|nr:hypothetical protein [Clostridiales bacterium]
MKHRNKYMPAVIVCIILMFLLILPAAVITKGKQEVSDLTALESGIILGLIAAEIAVVVIMFVFAFKAGKETDRIRAERGSERAPKEDRQDRVLKTRGWVIILVSFLLAGGFAVLGALFGGTEAGKSARTPMLIILCAAFAATVAELVFSSISAKRFMKSMTDLKVAERQELLLKERSSARENANKTMAELKTIRKKTYVLAAVMFLTAVFIVFTAGAYLDKLFIPFLFWSAAIMSFCAGRLPFKTPTVFMNEAPGFTKKEDYPILYSIAEKAASDLGCRDEIRIRFFPDGGIGVAGFGDKTALHLGLFTLCQLSEDELASVLHHEFSHIMSTKKNPEIRYAMDREGGAPDTSLSAFGDLMFRWLDIRYALKYSFYRFANSIIFEEEADRAMTLTCDKSTAASALIKTGYYESFLYEDVVIDKESLYLPENPDEHLVSKEWGRFKKALSERSGSWNSLIPKQILSRSDSHPTLDMRLKTLGVSEYGTVEKATAPEYAAELEKAMAFVDALNCELMKEDYKEARKAQYLDPLKKTEEWRAQGEPVTAEGYRDITDALESLGRFKEAESVCDRAIATLPEAASHFALFKKGVYSLRRYDDAGIELIYRAIDANKNYVEDGLEEIGAYCCLTGNEAELERYRSAAAELGQKQEDEYDEIDSLKKGDKLTREELPDGALERDLAFIAAAGGDILEKVYLVRKTVSDDFFTSAYVVRFEKGADNEARGEVMQKIFNYLDTVSDWQYSLFDFDYIPNVSLDKIEGCLVYESQNDR